MYILQYIKVVVFYKHFPLSAFPHNFVLFYCYMYAFCK